MSLTSKTLIVSNSTVKLRAVLRTATLTPNLLSLITHAGNSNEGFQLWQPSAKVLSNISLLLDAVWKNYYIDLSELYLFPDKFVYLTFK